MHVAASRLIMCVYRSVSLQAKTTKKIVLRMQCQDCKQTCMKGLKVSGSVGKEQPCDTQGMC